MYCNFNVQTKNKAPGMKNKERLELKKMLLSECEIKLLRKKRRI